MKKILSAFDITGPIMIGPSSSHTAGACRLSYAAQKILGEEVTQVVFQLYGSFKETLNGHGTDKALLGGILGFEPSDERIRMAYELAMQKKLNYSFIKMHNEADHPNTVVFKLTGVNGAQMEIKGASVGGGNILITKIDNTDLKFTGKYSTLITRHWDQPGVVLRVSEILTKYHINIANMNLYREYRNDLAYMIIETDENITQQCLDHIRAVTGVDYAVAIARLF